MRRARSRSGGRRVTADRGTPRPARVPRPRVRRGPLIAIVVLAVVGFLYARPIASYLETRDQLTARQAEVVALRAEKGRVDARLARASSVEALARDARRIGQVRPGEQLFIVKGLEAWRKQHAAAGR